MSVLLIDNYDSFTYNLYQQVQTLTEESVEVFRNDAISLNEVVERRPTHIILSPGPGHPGIDSDFGVCKQIILEHNKLNIPVLGVCLGHQGIIHYLGGKITRAPFIVHGKTSMVRKTQPSPLLDGLPEPFKAMRYHSLVAEESEIPSCLKVTAKDVEQNLVMAIAHIDKPLYGVQFHPESIGTPEGGQMMRNFLEKC